MKENNEQASDRKRNTAKDMTISFQTVAIDRKSAFR